MNDKWVESIHSHPRHVSNRICFYQVLSLLNDMVILNFVRFPCDQRYRCLYITEYLNIFAVAVTNDHALIR